MSTKLIDMTGQLKTFLASSSPTIFLQETNGISGISIIEAHIQKRRLEPDWSGNFRLSEGSGSDANCLNVVNVAVAERNRRKGLFTDFLELLEGFDYGTCTREGSDFHVRIDSVMNPVLDEFLPRRGYARIRTGTDPYYSYVKIVCHTKRPGAQGGIPRAPGLAALRGGFHVSGGSVHDVRRSETERLSPVEERVG